MGNLFSRRQVVVPPVVVPPVVVPPVVVPPVPRRPRFLDQVSNHLIFDSKNKYEIKEGVRVEMKYLTGQTQVLQHMEPDELFPNDYWSIGLPQISQKDFLAGKIPNVFHFDSYKALNTEARLLPQFPQEGNIKSMEHFISEIHKSIFDIEQGQLEHCFLSIAIFLMAYFHPTHLMWTFSRPKKDSFYSRLKFDNSWIIFQTNGSLTYDAEKKLPFLKAGNNLVFAQVLEFLCGKAHSCLLFLQGGLVSEAMSWFMDIYGMLYDPSKMDLLEFNRTIYAAYTAGKMIALGSMDKEDHDPLVHPDLPYIPYCHAFGVVRVFRADIFNIPSMLIALREPHGITITNDFSPGEYLFINAINPDAQKIIVEECKKKGVFIVPAEVIFKRFKIMEIMARIPPRPENLTNTPTKFSWEGHDVTMWEFKLDWSRVPAEGLPFETPDGNILVIVIVTQLHLRLGYLQASFHKVGFKIRVLEDGSVLETVPVRQVYKPTTSFRTSESRKFAVEPECLTELAKIERDEFEVHVICLDNVDAGELLPTEIELKSGELMEKMKDALEQDIPSVGNPGDRNFYLNFASNLLGKQEKQRQTESTSPTPSKKPRLE